MTIYKQLPLFELIEFTVSVSKPQAKAQTDNEKADTTSDNESQKRYQPPLPGLESLTSDDTDHGIENLI